MLKRIWWVIIAGFDLRYGRGTAKPNAEPWFGFRFDERDFGFVFVVKSSIISAAFSSFSHSVTKAQTHNWQKLRAHQRGGRSSAGRRNMRAQFFVSMHQTAQR
jgi:hypothetical protein